MSIVIQQGLLITVIGMGLVFAVIIFLWWMMGALVRVTTKEEVPEDDQKEPVEAPIQAEVGLETHRRAAAAAVAVAVAMGTEKIRHLSKAAQAQAGGMSPWQSVHRTQQLEPHNKRG